MGRTRWASDAPDADWAAEPGGDLQGGEEGHVMWPAHLNRPQTWSFVTRPHGDSIDLDG